MAAAQTCGPGSPLVLLGLPICNLALAQLADISLVGYKSEISYFPDYEVRSRLPLQSLAEFCWMPMLFELNPASQF